MAEPHRSTRSRRRPSFSKRPVPAVVMGLAFLGVALIGYLAGSVNTGALRNSWASLTGVEQIDLSSVEETYYALRNNFDGELDTEALIQGANKGLVDAADDQYTVYLNAQAAEEFNNDLTGNIGGGIGVEIGLRSDQPTVVRVLQDNPAEKAGVRVNDMIIGVNDEDAIGWSVSDVVEKVRGEAGTSVKLTVLRSGEEKSFSITREQVNNPSAYGEVRDGVGILTITRFDDDTATLARTIARDFKSQNVKGVVLDLRGNGGGYVTAAQDVASIWLDNKVVVTERRGGQVTEELKSGSNPILNGVQTVVLVNESSASASEIVAGALRDHKAATLVGETTFGKGSVQKLVNLSHNAILKVTIARWYTPAGVNISETGIKPDKEVTRSSEDFNAGKDPQLDAALQSF